MPDLKLPSAKLPGFRDMNVDDIRNAIADVPRPDIRLSDIADAASAATHAVSDAASNAAATAASTVADRNPIRRQRSSRRPMLLAGLVVTVLGLVALANATWIRARLTELGQRARERMDANRVSGSLEPVGDDAYTGTVGIPIESEAYADTLPSAVGSEGIGGSGSYESASYDTNTSFGDAGYEQPHENGQHTEDEVRSYGS